MRAALGISILLLAGAFFPHHRYTYFILLRWVVFLTAAWGVSASSKNQTQLLIFVAIAVLHNPFLEFHFSRDTWLIFDGMTAAWFTFKSFSKGSIGFTGFFDAVGRIAGLGHECIINWWFNIRCECEVDSKTRIGYLTLLTKYIIKDVGFIIIAFYMLVTILLCFVALAETIFSGTNTIMPRIAEYLYWFADTGKH